MAITVVSQNNSWKEPALQQGFHQQKGWDVWATEVAKCMKSWDLRHKQWGVDHEIFGSSSDQDQLPLWYKTEDILDPRPFLVDEDNHHLRVQVSSIFEP
jgi:hypothetical protein